MNKQFGTRIMVSEWTAASLVGVFVLRLLMSITVVGKDYPVRVYEVMGLQPVIAPDVFDRLREEDERGPRIETTDGDSTFSTANASATMSLSMASSTRVGAVTMIRDVLYKTGTVVSPICTEVEVAFARLHSDAVNLYLRRCFADCASTLMKIRASFVMGTETSLPSFEDTIIPTHVVEKLPNADAVVKSIAIVEERCEHALKHPHPESYDVTYRASEK